MTYTENVIAGGGSCTLRAQLTDCEGTMVSPSDVAAITLNIYEYLNPSAHVDGYYDLAIPTTAMLATYAEDCQGRKYNFSYNPYHDNKPMFPRRQTVYVVEVVWTDTNGKPYAQSMEVLAQ